MGQVNKKLLSLTMGYKMSYDTKYPVLECDHREDAVMEDSTVKTLIQDLHNYIKELPEGTYIDIRFDSRENFFYTNTIDKFISEFKDDSRVDKIVLPTNGSIVHRYIDTLHKWTDMCNGKLDLIIYYDYSLENTNYIDINFGKLRPYQKVRNNILLLDKENIPFTIMVTLNYEDFRQFYNMYNDYLELSKELTHKQLFRYFVPKHNRFFIDKCYRHEVNRTLVKLFQEAELEHRSIDIYNFQVPEEDELPNYSESIYINTEGSLYTKDDTIPLTLEEKDRRSAMSNLLKYYKGIYKVYCRDGYFYCGSKILKMPTSIERQEARDIMGTRKLAWIIGNLYPYLQEDSSAKELYIDDEYYETH